MRSAGWEPEPFVDVSWRGQTVPVAESWQARARPEHWQLVVEMLRALPARRLTQIVGHAHRGADSWMACNDGPDGHGSWIIPVDVIDARRTLAVSAAIRAVGLRHRVARGLRRLADLVDVSPEALSAAEDARIEAARAKFDAMLTREKERDGRP